MRDAFLAFRLLLSFDLFGRQELFAELGFQIFNVHSGQRLGPGKWFGGNGRNGCLGWSFKACLETPHLGWCRLFFLLFFIVARRFFAFIVVELLLLILCMTRRRGGSWW